MKDSKGYIGIGMNGFIARSYDKNSRKYSMGMYRRWAERLAGEIQDGSVVLEVASGPGYLAIELARRKNYRIMGLEISPTFVEIARKNSQELGVEVDFRLGNAGAMPFDDGMFDFIMCTSSFKNFSEPLACLREMHRVLKKSGKVWISDLRRDVSDETVADFVATEMRVKGLAAVFMRYTFKHTLRPRAYTGDQFKNLALAARFDDVLIRTNAMDFEAFLARKQLS